MLEFLKREAGMTRTENGALAYASAGSACLDFFAAAGGLRRAEAAEVAARFARAYEEDPDTAMKLLFYARDVRGGLGERRVFRAALAWLAENAPASVEKNVDRIGEYGRYDDLVTLLGTPCEGAALAVVRRQLARDMAALETGEGVSLLAKWLPSVNASAPETAAAGKRVARGLGMREDRYRRTLSALRRAIGLLENDLRRRDYTFDYEKQPSRALFKYRSAFLRNDGARYGAYLESVRAGKARMNTDGLAPYDIIAPFFQGGTISLAERRAVDAAWRAQRDFTGGENALVVIDGSGSMYGGGEPLPAAVAMSLGIYYGERNTGPFRDHFITFSARPRLVEIQGADIYEKVRWCHRFNEVANTDLQRVFRLILDTAAAHRLPQSQLPARLYIISDMEFDDCVEGGGATNFEFARRQFLRQGYRLPQVVFWNVASRSRQQPVRQNEQGAALVSGCSPRIFSLLQTGALTPYGAMRSILDGARYRDIAA